jgi:hippurate hydrolase
VRKLLLDGIKRIARGEAIAAGMPEDRMPVVTVREEMYTPATFNTEELSNRALELFTASFGAERVKKVPAVMGGEDFSRFWLADKSMESLIFWVGGVPARQWQAAGGDAAKLPSLHSPFWAPDAEAVISTASEALTLAALDVLKKG